MNLKSRLKPCPFCGESNCDLEYRNFDFCRVSYCSVYCNCCSATGPSIDYGSVRSEKAAEEMAVESWNFRKE